MNYYQSLYCDFVLRSHLETWPCTEFHQHLLFPNMFSSEFVVMKFLYRYWDSFFQFPSPYTVVVLMQFPLLFLMILSRIINISVFIPSNQHISMLQLVYHHALFVTLLFLIPKVHFFTSCTAKSSSNSSVLDNHVPSFVNNIENSQTAIWTKTFSI